MLTYCHPFPYSKQNDTSDFQSSIGREENRTSSGNALGLKLWRRGSELFPEQELNLH